MPSCLISATFRLRGIGLGRATPYSPGWALFAIADPAGRQANRQTDWLTRRDMRMPFSHLRTQGFWQESTLEMTTAQSPESCFACEMKEEIFELLGGADFRLKARLPLVSRYFEPCEGVALLVSLGFPAALQNLHVRDVVTAFKATGGEFCHSPRFRFRQAGWSSKLSDFFFWLKSGSLASWQNPRR
jgi:hypothetical protein